MAGLAPESREPDQEAARIARVYERYRSAGRTALYDPSNRGNRAIFQERLRWTRRVLERAGLAELSGRRVLDVGCGFGHQLARMREFGAASADLVGVDILSDRIEEARRAYPDIEFRVANAVALSFPSESFDLLLSFTVFSSILRGAPGGGLPLAGIGLQIGRDTHVPRMRFLVAVRDGCPAPSRADP